MTIEAELPDGTVLEFPDGTSPQVIKAAAQRLSAPKGAPAAPAAAPKQGLISRASSASARGGTPTTPLAGSPAGGLGDRLAAVGDQMYRTIGGGAADLADAIPGLINRPLNAVLKQAGVDYQFPNDQLGSKVPQPVGALPQIARAFTPFILPAAGAEAAAVKGAEALAGTSRLAPQAPTIAAKVRAGITSGAPIDAGLAPSQDQNISNLVESATGVTLPTARRATDSAGVRSLKDMAEGGVVGGSVEGLAGIALKYFSRGASAPRGTPEAAAEEAAVEQAVADPVVRAQLEASGITPETSPRYAEFAARAEVRQAQQMAAQDQPGVISRAVSETAPPAGAADAPAAAPPAAGLTPETVAQLEAIRTAPNVAPTTRADIEAVLANADPQSPGFVDPSTIRAAAPRTADVAVTPPPARAPEQGFTPEARMAEAPAVQDPALQTGRDLRNPRNLPVPLDAPTPRMSDAEVAQSARMMDAGQPQGAAVRAEPLAPAPDAQMRAAPMAAPAPERSVTYSSAAEPQRMLPNPEQRALPAPEQRLIEGPTPRAEAAPPAAAQAAPPPAAAATPAPQAAAAPLLKGSPVAVAPVQGRFAVDEQGGVVSDKGGPVKFGQATQAQNWVKNVGGKQAPTQAFEVVSKEGGGWTVRETKTAAPETSNGAAVENVAGGSGARYMAPSQGAIDESSKAVQVQSQNVDTPPASRQQPSQPEVTARASEPGAEPTAREAQATPARAADEAPTPRAAEPTPEPAARADAPPKADSEPEAKPTPARSAAEEAADDAEVQKLYDRMKARSSTKMMSGVDPADVKEMLIDPAVKVVKREIDETKYEFGQTISDLTAVAKSMTVPKALDVAATTVRKVWWSNVAAIRAVAVKYPDVPEIREIADLIGTDPGRGRVVGQTYERAVQMRGMGMANRLQNILGDKVKPEFEARVADILAGRKVAVGGTAEQETARKVRKLLDEQHDYVVEAGLEVGYVKGRYFPRVLDDEAVLKAPDVFKTKATDLYRKMGLAPEEAKFAAEAWYGRVLGVADGAYSPGLSSSRATKGRTLPAEADQILKDFYVTDPRANLTNYFRQTSRSAEYARRFGADGSKAQDLFNSMLTKGVAAGDVENVRHHFESSTGQLYATRPDKGAAALSWIQTAGVLRLLPRAVISSAAEALAVGVRAHDVGSGFKALADSYATVFGLRDPDDMTRAAEALGIIGDAMNDLVLSAQFGGEIGGVAQQKLLSRFFRVTQLHAITEAQRLAAARVGQGMIRTLLADVSQGSKRQKSAARLLAELGMDDVGAKNVAAWLSKNNGSPAVTDLVGPAPEAVMYRTALQRFVDESIQNPTAADRPQWASHPFGRLAYGITSFMFSFTRNVLVRTGRETAEGVFGAGYTLEDRVRLLTPALALGVLAAAQSEVSELRDKLLNPQAAAERSKIQKLTTNISRSGLFGNADPFINIALSARYNRDLTSTLTGPYLTAYLDSFSKLTIGLIPKSMGGSNTPNTNNAEWQAAKAGYEMVMAPLLAAAASYAPGGPVLRVGYGAGLVGATSPGASRAFADKVAGERTVKPRASDVEQNDGKPSTNEEVDDMLLEDLNLEGN